MGKIYWELFDWQSFSTLVTGFAAVGGATFVGWRQSQITKRQASIAEKQNEILSHQTQLERLALRNEMFERRYEVFASVEGLLGEVAREGKPPDLPQLSVLWQAMGKSKFLFAPAVHNGLDKILKRLSVYRLAQGEMKRACNNGKQPDSKWIDAEAQCFAELIDDLKNLPELFGDELRLSEMDSI